MTGVVANGIYFNTESGLSAPGGLLDRFVNPDTQLKARQVAALDTFKDGLPTTDGKPSGPVDWNAAGKLAIARGAFEPGAKMLEFGLQQRQLEDAGKLTSGMTKWLTPGAGDALPSSTSAPPSVSTKGANPEVVAFIRERAPAWGINPNAALFASGREGLFGFDPSGNANPGDGNSSFGPFQLHYGGVAQGGNAVPGLGDDFTKATGLDARDPSTWKAQVDFALAHAAKKGWGAFHGAAKGGLGEWSGITRDGGGQPQSDTQPIQVAQNGASDAPPPSEKHPFAPIPPVASGSEPPPAPAMAFGPGRQEAPPPQAPTAQSETPRLAPMPQTFSAPPPLSPNAGAATPIADQSFGGQVPQAWLRAGHSAAEWVRYMRTMAALGSGNKFAQGAAEQWSKLADGLQTSIEKQSELTNEQKNSRDPGAVAYEHQREDYRYQAREGARIRGASALKEAEQEGEGYGKIPAQLATAADSARNQNSMVDAMMDAATQFNMGKYADREQGLNSIMSSLGHRLKVDTSSIDGKVASYEEFAKLAGQFSRQAMKETGGRAGGIQELQFITNTLPSPTMSMDGFRAVANQLKGLGDFNVAKQQAGEAWLNKTGSMRGFDTTWNKQVSPAAFVMHRLQVDQPEVFSQTVKRLAQSAQGRATLQSMRSGMAWAGSAGLFD